MVDADFLRKYQECYNDPDTAEELIRKFWKISEFSTHELKKSLMAIADDEFDDDYQEFLRKDVLLKSALRMIGANGKLKEIEAVLGKTKDLQERIISVVPLLADSPCSHIKNLRSDMAETYDTDDYYFCLIAESAVLLVLAKNLLNSWSQSFSRICESHPEPFTAIANMTGMAIRGENVIAHARGYTHRSFDDAGKNFEELLNADDLSSLIWRQKRKRLENALSREV